MTPKEIQAALKNKGTTQKNIALDLGVAEMTVSNVIHGRAVSDRIFTAISKAIGKPKDAVFAYYRGPKLRKTSKAFGQIDKKAA